MTDVELVLAAGFAADGTEHAGAFYTLECRDGRFVVAGDVPAAHSN